MNYELMLILKPDASESEQREVLEKIKKLVLDAKGKLVKEEAWGQRNLAYPIQRFSEGVYHLFRLDLPSDKISDLEKQLNLNENVLRFMIVQADRAQA